MKAIINLTTIAELPCDIATADNLNALLFMKARIYEYTDYISVTLSRESVVSIHFVD